MKKHYLNLKQLAEMKIIEKLWPVIQNNEELRTQYYDTLTSATAEKAALQAMTRNTKTLCDEMAR